MLDAVYLREHSCWFGGGTAIALSFGEYRESADMDLLVSDVAGYREVRQKLSGQLGLGAILRPEQQLVESIGAVRADQYGIRGALVVDATRLKFEIVLEGRLSLDTPDLNRKICGVTSLSAVDMVATKLLANSDWWADPATFNRDLIDLAMMRAPAKVLRLGLEKAHQAYGASVVTDVRKAQEQLAQKFGWMERCLDSMAITVPKAVVWDRVKRFGKAVSRVSV